MSDRMKPFAGGKKDKSLELSSNMHDHDDNGRREKRHGDYFDLFGNPKSMKGLNIRKFGSESNETEALCERRSKTMKYGTVMYPNSSDTDNVNAPIGLYEQSSSKNWQVNQLSQDNAIGLKGGQHLDNISAVPSPFVYLSSYGEGNGDRRHSHLYQKFGQKEPARKIPGEISVAQDDIKSSTLKKEEESKLRISAGKKASYQPETKDERVKGIDSKSPRENVECKDLKINNLIREYKYDNAENHNVAEDDLDPLWKEMDVTLECSKDGIADTSVGEKVEDEGCDHSFILKDDIGYVCRVCGVIQKGIESIIEFSFKKEKRTSRSYISESRISIHKKSTKILRGFRASIEESMPTRIAAHPRHMNQMKPHQVEGFNFLCSNLIADEPGGCILAHAPGSGKTFMLISFMQSFLALSPHTRPLVVLPKGILSTWKTEFQTWQVEDLPLYDFYSVKADNRAQQLDILRKWVEHKSVLFLGYKQFSSIICDKGTEAAECKEILLKVPTILVLDEGHTPRNEETEVLQSLAKVHTPLKVVLSGTLYQNHVKEVFNILKLVRSGFMKSQSFYEIQRRIMSRVQISRMRNISKSGSDIAFFNLVEKTLQQKDDSRLKAAVVRDLREMTSKILHYYKGDFLDELPGLVDYTLLLNLSSRQKSEVEKLKKMDNFKRASVGSLLYVHPQLKSLSENFSTNGERGFCIGDEKMDNMVKGLIPRDGAKAKFFLNILNLCQAAAEKLLVFSQYILPLKLFERLSMKFMGWSHDKELFMITGDSSHERREYSMERFNNSPDAKVLFGSIKACGEGISLVGASRIIILDVYLNPSVTRQAIGRAFRTGQERKVYTYRLIAADSPEEEDHNTCFRKELIAKMWFEWNENYGNQEFEMKAIDINECGDPFLESPSLREDIKTLYRR